MPKEGSSLGMMSKEGYLAHEKLPHP